jgi:hypothetical protein
MEAEQMWGESVDPDQISAFRDGVIDGLTLFAATGSQDESMRYGTMFLAPTLARTLLLDGVIVNPYAALAVAIGAVGGYAWYAMSPTYHGPLTASTLTTYNANNSANERTSNVVVSTATSVAATPGAPNSGPDRNEQERRKWAHKYKINADSPTGKQLLDNLDMSVDKYISLYRKATIRREFPSNALAGTVRQAIENGASDVRKLLVDSRWAK